MPQRAIPTFSLRAAQREMARARILAAARTMFVADGVAATSIDAIARHAGVGRATVYRHFAGKDALLLGLLEEDWDRQVMLFGRLGGDGVLDASAVTAWLGRLARAVQARRGALRLYTTVLSEFADMSDRLAAQRARLTAALGEHIPAFAGQKLRLRVEAMLLVMQIEHFCSYATVGADEDVEIATELIAARILEFANRHPSSSAAARDT